MVREDAFGVIVSWHIDHESRDKPRAVFLWRTPYRKILQRRSYTSAELLIEITRRRMTGSRIAEFVKALRDMEQSKEQDLRSIKKQKGRSQDVTA